MKPDYAHKAMLHFPCDYCRALPEEWCVTKSGAKYTYLHSARFYRWQEAIGAHEPPPAPRSE